MEASADLMAQACERCWRRKQKCDRRRPTCEQCEVTSSQCLERRLGNTIDPSDPGAQLSYIETLKRRVQQLEAQSASTPSPETTTISPSNPVPERRASVEATGAESAPTPAAEGEEPNHGPLQAEIGSLSLAAMAEFSGEHPSRPANYHAPFLSFQTLFLASASVSACNPSSAAEGPNPAVMGAVGEFHRSLSRHSLHLAAIDCNEPFQMYLDTCLSSFPFASITQLRQDYDTIMVSQGATTEEGIVKFTDQAIRVYIAVASGICLLPSYRTLEPLSTVLALTAHQHLPRVVTTDLALVQCLTSIVVFSLFSPFGGSTWHLLGLTMTRSVAAGMHHSRVSDPEATSNEKKGCSRVFWCLYILDTLISSSMVRPFFIQDDDITTTPPSHQSPDRDPTYFHISLIQLCQLLRSAGRDTAKGALYHVVNIRHCKDIMTPSGSTSPTSESLFQQGLASRLTSCALLTIVATLVESAEVLPMVCQYAEDQFLDCLEILSKQASPSQQIGCPPLMGSDGLLVFRIVIEVMCNPVFRQRENILAKQQIASQRGLRILNLMAQRFTAVASLESVLSHFTLLAYYSGGHGFQLELQKLEHLMEISEIPLPARVRQLMQDAVGHVQANIP